MRVKRARFLGRDRRQQIIQVAMELFARQGFEGTTTRQIAERAHVNEALIFRHFSRKEDLYWAVIEAKCHCDEGRKRLEEPAGAKGSALEFFTGIADEILQRNTDDITLSRLLLYSALERHQLSHRFFRTYMAEYYEVLAGVIRKRIRAGSFRRVDASLAARGFLGMVIYHFLVQELFGGKRYQKFNSHKVSETLTEIWLGGMETASGRGRGNPIKRR